MSNVKQIHIVGRMTFDASPGELVDGVWTGEPVGYTAARKKQDAALRLLGQISLPTIGLDIVWGKSEAVENDRGGRMTLVEYEITGSEAYSWKALESIVQTLRAVGAGVWSRARDLEDGGEWVKDVA